MKIFSYLFLFSFFALTGCQTTDSIDPSLPRYSLQAGEESVTVVEKSEPSLRLFSTKHIIETATIKEKLPGLAQQIAVDAVKRAKLEIDGPLTMVMKDLPKMEKGVLDALVGYPVKGRGPKLARYNVEKKEAFKCLSVVLPNNDVDSDLYWRKLYELAASKGYKVSDETRVIISRTTFSYKTELQLGVL